MGEGPAQIDLDGAELISERPFGTLGQVFLVKIPDGLIEGTNRLLLLPLQAEEGEDWVELVRRDAERLISFRHPNLVRVRGFGVRKENTFLVLDHVDGVEFSPTGERQPISQDEAVSMALDVARACEALSERGLAHGDLCSSAVIVAGGNRALLIPLAVPETFKVEHRACPGQVFNGSPQYAAPELHATGGREVTEKSNIFAFGVLFYEMLTGCKPFRGGTPTRVLLDIIQSTPTAPTAVVQSVAPELERICMRCLEKDPEKRFPSFSSLAASLRIAAETAAVASSRKVPSTRLLDARAGKPRGPRLKRQLHISRRQLMAIGVVGAVMLAMGLILAFVSRKRGKSGELHHGVVALYVLDWAERLLREGKGAEAMRLLEENEGLRRSATARYEDLVKKSRLQEALLRAARMEGASRWEGAARALEEAESLSGPDPSIRRRLNWALFNSMISRAKRAEAKCSWEEMSASLEKATRLALEGNLSYGAAPSEDQLVDMKRALAYSKAMTEADGARAAGDSAAEKKHLLAAAGARPESSLIVSRLEELGAGPRPARLLLERARDALAQGNPKAARLLVVQARDLWPPGEEAKSLLSYLGDLTHCRGLSMVLVSQTRRPTRWGSEERQGAFCADPYEFPNVPGGKPRVLVSAVEAAALCAERGCRLCKLYEWQLACGGLDSLPYPYGRHYDRSACNTEGLGPETSGKRPGCRSPYGVSDMSGNLAEWTADSIAGEGTVVAGGDWSAGADLSKCSTVTTFNPGLISPRIGFRCCRSLPGIDEPREDSESTRAARVSEGGVPPVAEAP